MRYQFSFKHMAVSPALQRYAEEKIQAVVGKFVTKPIEVHVTFAVERHTHTAHCDLHAGDGFNLSLSHGCEDMYASVDHLVDKLTVQLKRKKDRLKSHKGSHSVKESFNTVEEMDEEDYEIEAADIITMEQARKTVG